MKVIGLTGRIGCGKSTVAGMLAARGVATLDADEVARDIRQTDPDARVAISARFGTLDPAALGPIVFGDARALADLEAILHPQVRDRAGQWLADRVAEGAAVAAIEAIKLLESPLRERCDEVWVITCRPQDAVERLARRGLSVADIQARRASQMAEADMIAAADVVIDGSAELGETERQAAAALTALTASGG